MPDDNNQQPVADQTNAPASQGAEGGGAPDKGGDELDRALAEFAARNKPAAPAPQPQPEPRQQAPQTDPAVAAELNRISQRLFRNDVNETVKAIRGDMDPEYFDDAFVRGWIEARVDENPDLSKAWVDREKDPRGFKKVVDTLSRDFAKRYSKGLPDRAQTEDRAAVTAAVRGASTKAPEAKPANFSSMSNQEFNKYVEDNYGYNPGT